MSKLTFELSVGNVKAYLNKLAEKLTFQIALDKDVVLQNTAMEGGSTIGISNWDDVRETIADALRLWVHAMSNRTALPVPIPKPIYTLLYYLVYRGCKDQRGGVRFKLNISGDFLPSAVDTGFQQALFGADGYFRKRFGFFEGVEYLQDGTPEVPMLIVGKENNLLTSKKTITEKAVKVPAHRVICALNNSTNAPSLAGLDGYDIDTTGLIHLLPSMVLAVTSQEPMIQGRLVGVNFILSPAHDKQAPGLAACWLMAGGDNLYAIRNVLPCLLNSAMFADLQRAIVAAEEMTPSVDLPSNVRLGETGSALSADQVSRVISTAYALMNPYALELTDFDYVFVSAAMQSISRAVGTVVQSESLRAHRFRFLTYNSPVGGMTGFTYFYTEPIGRLSAYNDIVDLEQGINSLRTVANTYKVVRSAPLVSQDKNRVPITPKYCLYVIGTGDDNTTQKADFDPEEKQPVLTDGIFKFIQKAMKVEVKTSPGGDTSFTVDETSLEEIAEFITGKSQDVTGLKAELEKIQGPDIDNNGVSRKEIQTILAKWVQDLYTTTAASGQILKNLYSFTKLKEAGLINNSEKLRYCFYYPLLYQGHLLIRNGYCKNGKFYEDPSRTIAKANLVDRNTGKAITEYGMLVTGFLTKGGFGGFGDILGTLTGSLGSIAGGFIGVPQLGQITGQLGKIGGDLLGDLF